MPQTAVPSLWRSAPFWAALASFLAGLGVCLATAMSLNDGHFMLAMDDPYIHLAVAENLARGTYGVNLGEFASPASSILWPILLVPFAALGVGEMAALGWNALATIAVLWTVAGVVWPATSDLGKGRGVVRFTVLVSIPVVLNLFAMTMLGMEHGLHIALSAGVIVGLHRMLRDQSLPWWLPLTVVVVGIMRYEALALSLCALVVMFVAGHRRAAALTGLVLIGIVGGFSLYLHSRSGYWVPVSVISKSGPVASGLAPSVILEQFARNRATPEGQMVLGGAVWMFGIAIAAILSARSWRLLWLVPVVLASVFAHLFLGRMDWFHRYELYVWAMLLVATLIFLGTFAARLPRVLGIVGTFAFYIWQSWPYIDDLSEVPVACNDTYQQQFQMHRFAVDYWRAPVAVNDLGWVAYQNDAYVLDLWQLGSVDSFRARKARDTETWLGLVPRHGVQLAMIYAHWFTKKQPLAAPESWIRIGSIEMSREPVIVNAPSVQFFATDPEAEPAIRTALERWAPTLPPGVRFIWELGS